MFTDLLLLFTVFVFLRLSMIIYIQAIGSSLLLDVYNTLSFEPESEAIVLVKILLSEHNSIKAFLNSHVVRLHFFFTFFKRTDEIQIAHGVIEALITGGYAKRSVRIINIEQEIEKVSEGLESMSQEEKSAHKKSLQRIQNNLSSLSESKEKGEMLEESYICKNGTGPKRKSFNFDLFLNIQPKSNFN